MAELLDLLDLPAVVLVVDWARSVRNACMRSDFALRADRRTLAQTPTLPRISHLFPERSELAGLDRFPDRLHEA